MDTALVSLVAASIALVGSHFALSHPLRAPLVRMLGAGGFTIFYSLVAAACMVWMYLAFIAAPAGGLPATGDIGWALASLLTMAALVLFAGSFSGNPALPAPGAAELATREPGGVFAVTRHPMMWSFALWAGAHLLLWWSWRNTIVAIAILILALVGAHFQDRKKRMLMGEAWASWEARTSYWPRWHRLPGAGALLWVLALGAWLGITWWHMRAGGVPAGIWRWV